MFGVALDFGRQRRHGRRLKKGLQRYFHSEGLPHSDDELCAQQRMPAQQEEIVVPIDVLQSKQVDEKFSDSLLGMGTGPRRYFVPQRVCRIWRRERRA